VNLFTITDTHANTGTCDDLQAFNLSLFFTFYGLGTVACFSLQTDAPLPENGNRAHFQNIVLL